ncbi:LysM peptidoglycan-binding domain-containing protein [Marivirga arenosa]|uniref:LysM peptidoglycan-binding domain-containing protein n=1 Tax=Marivirga arenosa TaxID=3059076 RepID=A0AA51ZVG3_9BACT|nr:LysM peptidoglycan-binding domain-containing protein [Marivirga sp. BKB1-2]WNB17493.1 LysM peptidoglycan-binding domain-containing protein [Marivirga sp. BKB1-2]
MKIKILFICFFIFGFFSFKVSAAVVDSVGIKEVDGVKFIIHKLEPKETLYSLGRRYHVSIQEIRDVNPQEKDGYKIDQIGRELLIPFKANEFESDGKIQNSANVKKHKVNAGETIYSISRKYEISQDDIMEWNNLTSTTLDIGQELIVSEPSQKVTETENIAVKQDNVENVIHIVDLGETIYSISKKYDITQSQIIKLNSLENNNIDVGQKLIIKENKVSEKAEDKNNNYQEITLQTFHNAKKGETYSSVAKMYNLNKSDLKKWNKFKEPFAGGEVIKIVPPKVEKEKLRKEEVTIADPEVNKNRIHTVESGETLYSLSEKYGVTVEELRKWNSLENYQLSLGQKLYIQNPDALIAENKKEEEEKVVEKEEPENKEVIVENPQKKDTKAFFTVEEDDIPKIDKVKEKGVAEVIEGSEGTEKYLALHRTAKIGTIMQVRNDLNDQIVFVRVLGKLPDTGVDDKVIIRISKKAFEKLGGVDYKFPVEISYLPLKD